MKTKNNTAERHEELLILIDRIESWLEQHQGQIIDLEDILKTYDTKEWLIGLDYNLIRDFSILTNDLESLTRDSERVKGFRDIIEPIMNHVTTKLNSLISTYGKRYSEWFSKLSEPTNTTFDSILWTYLIEPSTGNTNPKDLVKAKYILRYLGGEKMSPYILEKIGVHNTKPYPKYHKKAMKFIGEGYHA